MRQHRRVILVLLVCSALVAAATASATDGGRLAYVQQNGAFLVRAAYPAGSPSVADVTSQTSSSRHPVISPDGSRIAYMSSHDGTWQIYVSHLDGSAPSRVTSDLTRDALAPQWSPDGSKIVFYSQGADDSEIRTVRAAGGGGEVTLTSGGQDSYPDYSPDGTRIVFERTTGANADIWVMHADGSGAAALRATADRELYPSWSPDGKWIAFCAPGPKSPIDIWVMRADGTAAHDVTPDRYADADVSWTPDSQSLLFTSFRDGRNWSLYTTPVDGGAVKQLRPGPGDFPSEGPDGRLVFDAYKTSSWQVCVRTGGVSTCLAQGIEPALSPDGTRIAFYNNGNLWLGSASRGPATKLVAAGPYASSPAWSPEGRALAFVAPISRTKFGLYTLTLPKGKRRLVATSRTLDQPDWGANGLIAYEAGSSPSHLQLWVVGADGKGARKIADAAYEPAWSPDGTKLATVSTATGVDEISVQQWPNGAPQTLTSDETQKGDPFWSPDGTQVGYTQVDSSWGDARLVSVPSAGGAATLLLALPNQVLSGSWR